MWVAVISVRPRDARKRMPASAPASARTTSSTPKRLRRPIESALLAAGLSPSRGSGLGLGFAAAGDLGRGLLLPGIGSVLGEAFLQRFHQVDDLGALHGRAGGNDFLALDLAVDQLEHAISVLVRVALGLELGVRKAVDELLGERQLVLPDLRGLALVDLRKAPHL